MITPFTRLGPAFLGLLLVTAACAEPPTALSTATDAAPNRATALLAAPPVSPWLRVVDGTTGPGALYRVYVPLEWNGDLVTMAHPIRDALMPVSRTNELYMDSLATFLGRRGYAVAYSSYSRNGFAVKDGAQRTHQLAGIARSILKRPPVRQYLVGFSLGSAVSLSLIEQYPAQYNGALLLCGMVGGSLVETQYLGHVRTLFDVAFPGVLSGTTLGVPFNYMPNADSLQAAILPRLPWLLALASMRQTPLPYAPAPDAYIPTLVQSAITAVTFHARGIGDITSLAHGKSPFGNTGVTYEAGPLVPLPYPGWASMVTGITQSFDTAAARFEMNVAARNYLTNYYTPTGRIQRPVITVHNAWDPIVPAFHEDSLRQIVTAAGYAGNLAQTLLQQYGHCEQLGVDKSIPSWLMLEQWVRTGTKP